MGEAMRQIPACDHDLADISVQWTSDKPTKPGWYWYRKAGEGPHYADFSHTSGGDIYLVTFDGAAGEWAGPLEPPSA